MKKEATHQDCPSMQGWMTLRLLPSSSTEEPVAEDCYLTVKEGYLKWYRDESQTLGVGSGYIISKVVANEDLVSSQTTGGGNNTVKRVKSISFQLLTKDGSVAMELLSAKVAVSKYWHALLDMHFTYCTSKKQLSTIPSYAWEVNDGIYSSLSISNEVHLDLEGHRITVKVGLLDKVEDITNDLITQYQPSRDTIIIAHIALLQEQLKLAFAFLPKHRQLERDCQFHQMETIKAKNQLHKAENHIKFLTKHLDNIETMLPILQQRLDSSVNLPLGEDPPLPQPPVEVSVKAAEAIKSKPKSRSSSPSYSRSTTPTTTSWRVRYEQIQQELQHALEQMDAMKKDAQRNQKFNKSVQQIETLQHENRELREYAATVRSQMAALQQQMEELQEAALTTVQALQQQQLQQQQEQAGDGEYHEDSDDSPREVGQAIQIDLDLTAMNLQGRHSLESKEEYGANAVMEAEDWTQKYQSLLGAHWMGNNQAMFAPQIGQSTDSAEDVNSRDGSSQGGGVMSHNSQLVQQVMKAIRWPLVEERILTLIYNYYAASGGSNAPNTTAGNTNNSNNAAEQVMSMTRFFRFAKDFHITMVDEVRKGGNKNKTSPTAAAAAMNAFGPQGDALTEFGQSIANSTSHTLIYGEVSMIFTNAAKIETSDVKKKVTAFKVNGGNTSSSNRLSKHHLHTGTTISTSSAVLTRQQFTFAVEELGERLYGDVIREVAGIASDQMTEYERNLAVRATLELLWIQILIPHAVLQDLVPWPLVYMQDFVVALHHDASIADLIRHKMDVFVHVYYQACIDQASTGQLSNMTFFSQQLHRLLHRHIPSSADEAAVPASDRIHMMTFAVLSSISRSYGMVPYLTGEHQLYSIFRELVQWADDHHRSGDSETLRFPLIYPLPFELADVIEEATKQYLQRSMQTSSLLLTIWNHPLPAKGKGKLASNGSVKEEAVDIVNFIVTMGTVAMQAFSTSSTPYMRLDNLIQLLEKNIKSTQLPASSSLTPAGRLLLRKTT